MIYKSIFLSAFLVSVAIAHSNVDTRIQQLKADLFQKELALSKIGKEIELQEDLIESMMIKAIEAYSNIIRLLKTEEEKKEFGEKIDAFEKTSEKIFTINNVKEYLLREFFSDKTDHADRIEMIKSLLIRRAVEKEILKEMIRDYVVPFEEFVNMHLELAELEKQVEAIEEAI